MTEASIKLDVSIATVQRMRKRGILQTVRIGRAIRIPLFQIERICQNRNRPGSSDLSMEPGTSTMQKMDEAKDRALGRKIRRKRNHG